MYIVDNNELIIRKKQIYDEPVELLKHLFESHSKYIKETAYADGYYFIDRLQKISGVEFHDVNIKVGNKALSDVINNEEYYPVTMTFTIPSKEAHISSREISLLSFKIPEIDKKGLINVRDKKLSCINELNKSIDLSVDDKGNYQLKMIDGTLNFSKPTKKNFLNFVGAGSSCTLAEFATYIACKKGELDKDNDITGEAETYLKNKYCSISMRIMTDQIKDMFVSTIYNKVDNCLRYTNIFDFKLGMAREYINEYFSFNKIIGQYLAFEIVNYKKGTLITQKVIEDLRDKKIDKVYIRYNPKLSGYFIGENIGSIVIPEGTKVSVFLENKIPELKGYGYTPIQYKIDIELKKGTLIDNDINEFLHSINLNELKILKSEKGKETIDIPFYREIITSQSEMMDKLTFEDVEALCSFLTGILDSPNIFNIYNRDRDFLKNIYCFNESLSQFYRRTVNNFISFSNAVEFKIALNNALIGKMSDMKKLINKIINKTFDSLYENSYYNEVDYKNPAALLAASRKLITNVPAHGASMAMRSILMGHYGRLCPFDTPQSAKIGLTNSLAVRASIKNGVITAPYHPIIKKDSNYYISKEILYLTPKEEFKLKIGDIMQIKHKNENQSVFDNPIINTIVQARVPSEDENDKESINIESIPAFELDFVNVFEDQILSYSASLIPFIGGNDGARITFACSMFKQAEAVFKSERPYICTGMYKWLVEDTDYIVRADKNGEITDILKDAVKVLYHDRTEELIELQRSSLKTGNIIVMEIKKSVGEKFKKGDIIADSLISRDGYFSPGTNVFVAYMPYYGYNNEDGIVISEKASEKYTSLTYNKLKLTLGNYSKNNWKFKKYINNGEYVNENQSIICVTSKIENTKPKFLKASYGKSGILQSIGQKIDSKDDTITYTANIISFDEMRRGDKMSGRHGNKGVITLKEKNSQMPSFLNGQILDVILNPCGVPSRMNLGQLLEAHMGFVCHLLDLYIRSDSFNGATEKEIKELLMFCYDLANSDDVDYLIKNKYAHLPDLIKDSAIRRITYIKTWRGCFESDGTAYLINNRNGKKFANRVVVGCSYFMKLAHEVEHKRTERSGVFDGVTYASVSKQPMKGSKRKGGQTIGEMEMWALMAYGANNFLLEALHDKSDNVYIRNSMKRAIKNEEEYERTVDYNLLSNHGTEVFKYIIEGMNGYLETNLGTDISLNSILKECNMADTDIVELEELEELDE